MSVTLTDYTADVTNKGFDSVTQDPAITAAINAARRRILSARRWAWMRVLGNSTVNLVAGTNSAALTGITDLLYVDAVRLELNGTGYDLEPLPLEQLREYQNSYRARAIPEYWACVDGATPADIFVWPTPDAAYTARIDYVQTAADLSDASPTETVLPGVLRDAVSWGAAVDLSYRLRDQPGAQSAQGMYLAEVGQVATQERAGSRQSSKQIRKSGQWDAWEVC